MQELGAVDRVPADIGTQAVQLLTEAADRALDTGSLRVAIRHSSRALELALTVATTRAQIAHLHFVRASAFTEQRDTTAATADIDALLAIAAELDDVTLHAEGLRLRGSLSHGAGRLDDARRELGEAVDLLRNAEVPALLARAMRVRGFIEMFGGSLVDAEWFFGEADELYQTLGDERGLAYIEQHRAWIAFLSGELASARQRLTHAAETHTRLGDRNGVGWASGLLAFVEFFEGNFGAAEALAGTVAKEAELRGDLWAASMMNTLLADLRLWQGKLEEAADFAEKARVRFKQINDKFGLATALAPLVRAQVALGRHAAAQRSSEELLTLADTSQSGPQPLMAVAGAAMHRGNAHVAAAMAERAIAEIQAMGGATFEPTLVLALAYAQQGRTDEALSLVESIPSVGTNHPFTHTVTALVLASVGQAAEAIIHADAVTRASGATYLDLVFAYVAAAGAYSQLGDEEKAELSAQAAIARALSVGDVVATALAATMFQTITGKQHAAFDDHTALGDGWVQLVGRLATGGHEPAVASAGE